MQTKNLKIKFLAVVAALSLAVLACNMPAVNLGGQETDLPAPEIVQPSEGAQSITLTAPELNALIDQALLSQPGLPVKSLDITLDNGQLGVTGIIQQGDINLPVDLTVSAGVDGQGSLAFQIIEASLGPFPLPAEYRTQIGTLLNESLKQPIAEATKFAYIESIIIDDGVATIYGQLSK